MENRHGFCVLFDIKHAVGESEPHVAVEQARELGARGFTLKTIGADKGYHCREFIEGLRDRKSRPTQPFTARATRSTSSPMRATC